VIVLALDTCDARGSLAILRNGEAVQQIAHTTEEDYSVWLLPSVRRVLDDAGVSMAEVDAYAVATGPGSFTGLRVGLTTVKAWAEVYGRPIMGVSRLLAMASLAARAERFVAAFFDARRDQVFGGLFRREPDGLRPVGDEMVIAPQPFLEFVSEQTGQQRAAWLSMDPQCINSAGGWKEREATGETVQSVTTVLAPAIGRIGAKKLAAGQNVSALELDANYVRRSDAEVFWKPGAKQRAQ
jgi:tRNA threonylcarbamoyladenosine biosynthesis protein TsaB